MNREPGSRIIGEKRGRQIGLIFGSHPHMADKFIIVGGLETEPVGFDDIFAGDKISIFINAGPTWGGGKEGEEKKAVADDNEQRDENK